jgi:hypothetical protein
MRVDIKEIVYLADFFQLGYFADFLKRGAAKLRWACGGARTPRYGGQGAFDGCAQRTGAYHG